MRKESVLPTEETTAQTQCARNPLFRLKKLQPICGTVVIRPPGIEVVRSEVPWGGPQAEEHPLDMQELCRLRPPSRLECPYCHAELLSPINGEIRSPYVGLLLDQRGCIVANGIGKKIPIFRIRRLPENYQGGNHHI